MGRLCFVAWKGGSWRGGEGSRSRTQRDGANLGASANTTAGQDSECAREDDAIDALLRQLDYLALRRARLLALRPRLTTGVLLSAGKR